MKRIVITSDWHLDASTAGFERYEDVERAAIDLFKSATDEEQKADLFIFLGDLCDPDTRRSHRCIELAACIARNLAYKGVSSRWLVGNHDVVEDGHGTTTLGSIGWLWGVVRATKMLEQKQNPNPLVVDRPEYERFDEFALVWLPYVERSHVYDPEEFIESLPSFEQKHVIVCGHLTVPSAQKGSESGELARGRDIVFPVEACKRKWGNRCTLVNGHYHRRQVTRDGVHIPGSLVRLRFDEETNEPGYLVFEVA